MPAIPITIARRRAALAKRGLAFGSVLAFAATIGLAQSSHPATAATAVSSTSASPATQTAPSSGSFGQAQVSPSTSSQTPSVSTGAS
jgi:hypothetical protein